MRQLKIAKQITRRESPSLEKYLQDIGNIDLLTPSEEVALAKRIQKGDQEAFDRFVEANLRFGVSVAKQYQHQGLSLAELISIANIGLIKAARRFDPSKGFKFISYAVWWIRQVILQALAEDSRILRLPLNRIGSLNKILRAGSGLEQKYERKPTLEELAEVVDMSQAEVRLTLQSSSKHVSLDAPYQEGEDNTPLDMLEDDTLEKPDEHLVASSLKKKVHTLLNEVLNKRQYLIITYYFGLGGENRSMTLEEIGIKLSLTRERVRQIKERALKILSKKAGLKGLQAHLN